MRKILCLLLAAAMLVGFAPSLLSHADASAPVIYDASTNPYFNRTEQDVVQHWKNVLATGASYLDGDEQSYYERMCSRKAPYDQGALTQDTVDHMIATANYLRWLSGTDPVSTSVHNNDHLQRGALIRSYDFQHDVPYDSIWKPADMDQAFWNAGCAVYHNILCGGQTPRGSVVRWCNEGFYRDENLQFVTLYGIGHRMAILGSNVTNLYFGYAGSTGIGTFVTSEVNWDGAFSAFPAPGAMPTELMMSDGCAWSVEPNKKIFSYKESNLRVTVTEKASGESYVCTAADETLYLDSDAIAFMQPIQKNADRNTYTPGISYRIVISGLTDKKTGNAAEIHYDVNLFSMRDNLETKVVHAGSEEREIIYIYGMEAPEDLAKLLPILPDAVTVRTEDDRILDIPILGTWRLDSKNKNFVVDANSAALPDTVNDPDGLLQNVKLEYWANQHFNKLTLKREDEQHIGESNAFVLPADTRYSPEYDLYLLGKVNGTWSVLKHYDETSANFKNEYDGEWNHPSFVIDAWEANDSGLWVSFSRSRGRPDSQIHCYELSFTKEAAPASGKCGDNLTWSYDEASKVLTISGSGEMYDYMMLTPPWASFMEDIKTVILSDGISKVGAYAFSQCTSLESMSIPNSVKEISNSAFNGCSALKSLTLSNQITSIGWSAFFNCSSLTSITIPESVTQIEALSFAGCNCLTSVYFCGNAPKLGEYAFSVRDEKTGNFINSSGLILYYLDEKAGWSFPLWEGYPIAIWKLDVNPAPNFSDVKHTDWFYDAVNFAVSNNLFNGMGDNKFEPDTEMNRAMLVTVLWRYAGAPKEGTNTFTDVKSGAWYADAVSWASSKGIVNGVAAGKFDPNGNVTREQLTAILYRYCNSAGIAADKRGDLSPFPDHTKVSSWATDAFAWAVGKGLIAGISGKLDPQGNATRAQVATILMRFIENLK